MENNRKIRILHIITNLPVGGAQDNTLLTVEKLDREKYEVSLMCAQEGDWVARARAIPDLTLIFVNQLKRKIHPIDDLIAQVKVYRIIKRGNFDIVHTHSSKPGFVGRVAARLARVPVIIHTIHGFPFNDFMHPLVRRSFICLERFLSRISDMLITVSKLNLEKALSLRFAGPEKFRNIYSGIDFGKFDLQVNAERKKRDLGILNGEKIVGMVGRLSEQKAPLDFVRAMPEVLKVRKDIRFVLVGDGELKEQTLELSRKLEVNTNLMVLGFRDDIPELLPIFDVFVLTSLWEGLGRSLTEAMYTGRPVVATNVEGVPELVEDGQTGILVEPKDIRSIANGIIHFLEHPDDARRMGAAAAEQINERFQADRMVQNLDEVYQELLRRKGPRVRP
ncbi:MAG: glycosyltransferase family 4 protein [bacterium]